MPYLVRKAMGKLYIDYVLEVEEDKGNLVHVDNLKDAFMHIKVMSRLTGDQWAEANRRYWLQRNIDNNNHLFSESSTTQGEFK